MSLPLTPVAAVDDVVADAVLWVYAAGRPLMAGAHAHPGPVAMHAAEREGLIEYRWAGWALTERGEQLVLERELL